MITRFQEHARDLVYVPAGMPQALSVAPNYPCFVWSDSARSYDKTDRWPNVKGSTDGPQQCGSQRSNPGHPEAGDAAVVPCKAKRITFRWNPEEFPVGFSDR